MLGVHLEGGDERGWEVREDSASVAELVEE